MYCALIKRSDNDCVRSRLLNGDSPTKNVRRIELNVLERLVYESMDHKFFGGNCKKLFKNVELQTENGL